MVFDFHIHYVSTRNSFCFFAKRQEDYFDYVCYCFLLSFKPSQHYFNSFRYESKINALFNDFLDDLCRGSFIYFSLYVSKCRSSNRYFKNRNARKQKKHSWFYSLFLLFPDFIMLKFLYVALPYFMSNKLAILYSNELHSFIYSLTVDFDYY